MKAPWPWWAVVTSPLWFPLFLIAAWIFYAYEWFLHLRR